MDLHEWWFPILSSSVLTVTTSRILFSAGVQKQIFWGDKQGRQKRNKSCLRPGQLMPTEYFTDLPYHFIELDSFGCIQALGMEMCLYFRPFIATNTLTLNKNIFAKTSTIDTRSSNVRLLLSSFYLVFTIFIPHSAILCKQNG